MVVAEAAEVVVRAVEDGERNGLLLTMFFEVLRSSEIMVGSRCVSQTTMLLILYSPAVSFTSSS